MVYIILIRAVVGKRSSVGTTKFADDSQYCHIRDVGHASETQLKRQGEHAREFPQMVSDVIFERRIREKYLSSKSCRWRRYPRKDSWYPRQILRAVTRKRTSAHAIPSFPLINAGESRRDKF